MGAEGRSCQRTPPKRNSNGIATGGNFTRFKRTKRRVVHMEHAKFEPFGEPIELDGKVRPETAASKWLMRIGAGVFWALALTIIVARGVYFEPGIFDGFGQTLAFLQKLPAVF